MHDINYLTDEVLDLADVDILRLLCLFTARTDFKFTPEQWDKIVEEVNVDQFMDGVIPSQVGALLEDVVSLNHDEIRDVLLAIKFQRNLPIPIISPLPPPPDPVFVSRSGGVIEGSVFHFRRTCSACKPRGDSSLIVEVERTEVEHSMHLCPICVLEKNKK